MFLRVLGYIPSIDEKKNSWIFFCSTPFESVHNYYHTINESEKCKQIEKRQLYLYILLICILHLCSGTVRILTWLNVLDSQSYTVFPHCRLVFFKKIFQKKPYFGPIYAISNIMLKLPQKKHCPPQKKNKSPTK